LRFNQVKNKKKDEKSSEKHDFFEKFPFFGDEQP